ncbi:hypothetical protein [Marinoscillum furvescens]|nr:hypothetical protein [Marinoscillum furvescens]
MTHSDSLIDITWKLNATSFSFQLVNKSNSNLRINWNEAVYVDHSGTSGAIIHSEVKYIDKNKPQKPTVIVAGSKVEDIIVPSENIYYVSGQYGGWKTKPILPNWGRSQEELDALTDVYIDKDISILLPISSGEDTYEYLFKFHVNDFKNTGKMSVY